MASLGPNNPRLPQRPELIVMQLWMEGLGNYDSDLILCDIYVS